MWCLRLLARLLMSVPWFQFLKHCWEMEQTIQLHSSSECPQVHQNLGGDPSLLDSIQDQWRDVADIDCLAPSCRKGGCGFEWFKCSVLKCSMFKPNAAPSHLLKMQRLLFMTFINPSGLIHALVTSSASFSCALSTNSLSYRNSFVARPLSWSSRTQ